MTPAELRMLCDQLRAERDGYEEALLIKNEMVDKLRAALKQATVWWEWHASWEGTPEGSEYVYAEVDGMHNEVDDWKAARALLPKGEE